MRRLLIIPATLAITLAGCTSGPSQTDCYDAFEEALTPTIQAYAQNADDATLDTARAPIYDACANTDQLVNGMRVYPEVVGLDDGDQVTGAALNTICYIRADTAACEGYADYEF